MSTVALPTPVDTSLAGLLARVADRLDPVPDPWATDPVGWVRTRLGEFVWSKQAEVMESVRDNRFTAVRSAHSTGKSHIAARVIGHWLDSHPIDDVFVVSTAPSSAQVKAILWRYLKKIHKAAGLPGVISNGDPVEWKIDGALVGWGRKPADLTNAEEAATSFQGIHAKYVLVVLDEAGGIPEWLWTAVNTLATAPQNRVLAIGNPDDPTSHFEKVCRPGSKWNVIGISAFDSPNYTGEVVPDDVAEVLVGPTFVDEAKRDWGEDSPLYVSKVLGEFPESSDDSLIQVKWIRAAMARDLSGEAIADAGKAAMDVARSGKDETTLGRIRGGMFRITQAKAGLGDTMKAVGWLSELHRDSPAVPIIVDADGLGAGVFDRAREEGLDLPVAAFHGGRRAFQPRKFRNRRSEQFWFLRGLFEAGLIDIDPKDEKLQAQLGGIRWGLDSAGRRYVETKEAMGKRGLPSPDRADTLMMVTAPDDEWAKAYDDQGRRGIVGSDPETITGDLLRMEF